MRIVKNILNLRKVLDQARLKGQKIGFVPTMGYFHEGHLSLMRQAKKDGDLCVVSLFVNPKQFGPKEDLGSYPRDIKRDAAMIAKENVDILFIPSDNDIYPNRYLTYIDVKSISDTLCGKFRPGHFQGVATIVAKLLNIVQPDVMYLGQKDAQQVVVLKTMVSDLNFPVTIKTMPTLREKDGLAMSSRNIFLTPQERMEAPIVYQSLKEAAFKVKRGEDQASRIIEGIYRFIKEHSKGKIQYVACVDANTLEPLAKLQGQVLIALSVYFGKTRLIDNVILTVKESNKA